VKPKPKRTHREESEQMALIQWSGYHPIARDHLIAIPNGGFRNILEAIRLKRQGVRPGVFDLFLAYPCGQLHGLWIELKAPKPYDARITPEQQDWFNKMKRMKYDATFSYGWIDAAICIENYTDIRIGRIPYHESQ